MWKKTKFLLLSQKHKKTTETTWSQQKRNMYTYYTTPYVFFAYLFPELVNDDKCHTPEKLAINWVTQYHHQKFVNEKYYFRPCAVQDRSRRRLLDRSRVIGLHFSGSRCVVVDMRFLSQQVRNQGTLDAETTIVPMDINCIVT
jgi:hypothetical protein